MENHTFINSNPSEFDSNCAVCGGKHRDRIHCTEAENREFLDRFASTCPLTLMTGMVIRNKNTKARHIIRDIMVTHLDGKWQPSFKLKLTDKFENIDGDKMTTMLSTDYEVEG